MVIAITNLSKEFKIIKKEHGLKGSLKSLFFPNYRCVKAVDGISFHVKEGEVVGFIGPNGAGKSTTLKILTGILHPTAGSIQVLGLDPQKKRKKLAYQIGTVFGQKPQLMYHLPAEDSFYLFSKIYEVNKYDFAQRLDYLSNLFEIKDLMSQPVRKLSLGERMRCEIVASLLHKPRILFLDEPTIGLDILAKKKIRELIMQLNRNEKLTVLLTSHDLDDVERICQRLIIINHGLIIYDDSIEKIKRKLKNKIIEVTFDAPTNAKIEGKIIEQTSFRIKADIERKKVVAVVKKLSRYKVADILITEPRIEEIIGKMYA